MTVSSGENIRDVLERIVTEGKVIWNETSINEVGFDSLGSEMRVSAAAFESELLWYKSAKFYYPY